MRHDHEAWGMRHEQFVRHGATRNNSSFVIFAPVTVSHYHSSDYVASHKERWRGLRYDVSPLSSWSSGPIPPLKPEKIQYTKRQHGRLVCHWFNGSPTRAVLGLNKEFFSAAQRSSRNRVASEICSGSLNLAWHEKKRTTNAGPEPNRCDLVNFVLVSIVPQGYAQSPRGMLCFSECNGLKQERSKWCAQIFQSLSLSMLRMVQWIFWIVAVCWLPKARYVAVTRLPFGLGSTDCHTVWKWRQLWRKYDYD